MAGVFSRNAFAALGDGDDFAPVAAQPKAAAAPAPAAAPAAAPKANNSQPRNNNGPRNGGNRNNRQQGDRELNAAVPAGEGAKEDRAQNFARRGGRGGRASRGPGGNPRGNSGTYLGGAQPRREKGGARPFDRQSQTGRVDSEKAEAAGWGAEDGKKELEAEVLAEADAKAETPASGAVTPAPIAEEEEEDNTQTYEEYLAAKANKKLAISELPEARPANEGEDLFANAKVVPKKGDEEEKWLFGAPKAASTKQKKQKEAKTFIEVDFTSRPPRRDTREPTRGGRPARGRGEGRGRGGASRGSTRGQARSQGAAAPAVSDASAFPALA